MTLDNITINNDCPTIALWQQYRNTQVMVDYFNFLRTYFQTYYYAFLVDACMPALSIINAYNDYLQFYALNILRISVPINIVGAVNYDVLQKYDSANYYDNLGGTVPYDVTQFTKTLLFICDWSRANWDMPSLLHLIKNFTGLGYDGITVAQDDTNLDLITITMASTANTTLLQSLFLYYKDILNLPYGLYFNIILV